MADKQLATKFAIAKAYGLDLEKGEFYVIPTKPTQIVLGANGLAKLKERQRDV